MAQHIFPINILIYSLQLIIWVLGGFQDKPCNGSCLMGWSPCALTQLKTSHRQRPSQTEPPLQAGWGLQRQVGVQLLVEESVSPAALTTQTGHWLQELDRPALWLADGPRCGGACLKHRMFFLIIIFIHRLQLWKTTLEELQPEVLTPSTRFMINTSKRIKCAFLISGCVHC